jgi:serine/threonine protein kinase
MSVGFIDRFVEDHISGIRATKCKTLKKVNDYALLEVLGRGSHSKVHLALNTDTNKLFAAKAISTSMKDTFMIIQREIRLLRRLSHPNLVTLHEVLHSKREQTVYLLLDWAPYGSLSDLFRFQLSDRLIASIFIQICDALSYLHSQEIVHHDIKPANILLFDNGLVKLCDFGISRSFESVDDVLGSPAYQAPEDFSDDGNVLLDPIKREVWSLGISIYQTAFGKLPYSGRNVYEIANSIMNRRLEIPEKASESLKDLLTKMLNVNPTMRLNLEEVRKHRFFETATKMMQLPVERHQIPEIKKEKEMTTIKACVCDLEYAFMAQSKFNSWSGLYSA